MGLTNLEVAARLQAFSPDCDGEWWSWLDDDLVRYVGDGVTSWLLSILPPEQSLMDYLADRKVRPLTAIVEGGGIPTMMVDALFRQFEDSEFMPYTSAELFASKVRSRHYHNVLDPDSSYALLKNRLIRNPAGLPSKVLLELLVDVASKATMTGEQFVELIREAAPHLRLVPSKEFDVKAFESLTLRHGHSMTLRHHVPQLAMLVNPEMIFEDVVRHCMGLISLPEHVLEHLLLTWERDMSYPRVGSELVPEGMVGSPLGRIVASSSISFVKSQVLRDQLLAKTFLQNPWVAEAFGLSGWRTSRRTWQPLYHAAPGVGPVLEGLSDEEVRSHLECFSFEMATFLFTKEDWERACTLVAPGLALQQVFELRSSIPKSSPVTEALDLAAAVH